ncbi:MAG: hypothetical protein ACKOTE_04265 [Opitutaceae bacterium]
MKKPTSGDLQLELRSPAEPVAEGTGGGGRPLSFALSGVKLDSAAGR